MWESTADADDGLDPAVGGAAVAFIGVLATIPPVYHVLDDAAAGNSPLTTLAGNVPLLVLSGSVVAAGAWLAGSDREPASVRNIVRWAGGAVAFAVAVILLVIGVQVTLQGEPEPFVVATGAVLVAAVGGLLAGVRTAEQREAERLRFRGLFDHSPNPIAETEFVDGEAVAKRVNPAFSSVFGYDRLELVGEPIEEYIVPPDVDIEPLAADDTDLDLPPTDTWNREVIELETVDGRREFVRLTVPADADYGQSGYGIYIDITSRRQRMERLEVLARILRHDIRNRVNIIDSYASYLAEQSEDPSEELTEIRHAASDLLALGERTKIAEDLAVETPKQRAIDLVGTIEAVLEEVDGNYRATVEASLPESAYVNTTVDLATAVIEIVENAVVHNDSSDPTIEVTVERIYGGSYYDIEVVDDGPGIPPHQYEIVTGQRERTQVEHANGTGLWLAYWICRASGGELKFDATDEGSRVTLRLPAASEERPSDAVASTPRENRQPSEVGSD